MRRAQSADTHAFKQHRLAKNSSPVGSSFLKFIAPGMHLESEREKRREKKKKEKPVDFHTAKHFPKQATPFRYF